MPQVCEDCQTGADQDGDDPGDDTAPTTPRRIRIPTVLDNNRPRPVGLRVVLPEKLFLSRLQGKVFTDDHSLDRAALPESGNLRLILGLKRFDEGYRSL